MKKLSLFFITICCLLCIPACSHFMNQDDAKIKPEKLIDNANVLSSSQKSILTEKLNEISKRQECDVIIVTTKTLGNKTSTDYANDYFKNNDYGYGWQKDGILFLVSTDNIDWAISTNKFGATAFTSAGRKYLMGVIAPWLSVLDYNTAFTKFVNLSDDFLEQARNGKPYDNGYLPKSL